jgi:hypothetical protein
MAATAPDAAALASSSRARIAGRDRARLAWRWCELLGGAEKAEDFAGVEHARLASVSILLACQALVSLTEE